MVNDKLCGCSLFPKVRRLMLLGGARSKNGCDQTGAHDQKSPHSLCQRESISFIGLFHIELMHAAGHTGCHHLCCAMHA